MMANLNIKDKIDKSVSIIQDAIKATNHQVATMSFGKDSLVMVHLINRVKKIPVIFFREQNFQSKFIYPQKIAAKWDLEVYDYPPSIINYIEYGEYFEMYNFYYVDGINYIILGAGVRKYKDTDKKYCCAIKDFLMRPTVKGYSFNWDCVFHGHKQSDPVYIADKIDLPEMARFGKGMACMPIKDWTDGDIWEYIKKHNLPYDKARYDNKNEDGNADVIPTCYDCLLTENIGKKVPCKKFNEIVTGCGKTKEEHEAYRQKLLGVIYK